MTNYQHCRASWQTATSFSVTLLSVFVLLNMSLKVFFVCWHLAQTNPATPVKQILIRDSFTLWLLRWQWTLRWSKPRCVSLGENSTLRMLSLWFYSLARLLSRFSMSASPSSPLLPRALHSRNSTFMGSWLNSKSLPFFPRYTLPPTEPSWELRAAERVTRKVFLWEHGAVLRHLLIV